MTEHSEVRERIARALYKQGAYCGNCSFEGWDSCAECRWTLLSYAVAVLDVLGLEQVGWVSAARRLLYSEGDKARNPHMTLEPVYRLTAQSGSSEADRG